MFLFRSIFVGSFLFKIPPSFVKIIDCGCQTRQTRLLWKKKTALPGINSWSEATLSSPHSSLLVVNKSQQNFTGCQYYFFKKLSGRYQPLVSSPHIIFMIQTKKNPMLLRIERTENSLNILSRWPPSYCVF